MLLADEEGKGQTATKHCHRILCQ